MLFDEAKKETITNNRRDKKSGPIAIGPPERFAFANQV
jgi:hypothetical protein